MDNNNKDVELIDYLNVIWRWKWFIIIPTFLLMLLTGVCRYRAPSAWNVNAIIQPSNLLLRGPGGRLERIMIIDPSQLAIQINQASYNNAIAQELNLDPYMVPRITAENLRDINRPNYLGATNLVLVSTVTRDVEKGEAVLNKLFELVKLELDEKIAVEMDNLENDIAGIESQIKEKEIEIKENENQISLTKLETIDKDNEIKTQDNEIKKNFNTIKLKELDIRSKQIKKAEVQKEIESERNKIKIAEERIQSLREEMKVVKQRIDELDAQQKKALAAAKKEGEAINLLLFSNEIQQSLRYYSILNEDLRNEQVFQEDQRILIQNKEEQVLQLENDINRINTEIESKHTDIDNIRTRIATIRNQREKIRNRITSLNNLNDKVRTGITTLENNKKTLLSQKGRIEYTQLVKEPGPSRAPVGRNPLFMVVVVGFIFGVIFTILAFLFDYIKKHRISSV